MIIDAEEVKRRLNSEKNLANSLPASAIKVIPIKKEREAPVPKEARIIAGSLAKQGEKVADIATAMGMSVGQVGTAKNSKSPAIQQGIVNSLERVRELAIDRMMSALGLMNDEKFENASLKDLSYVAANMSRVIEKTSPRESSGTQVQLIIYAPQQKEESHYKTVDV